MIANILFSTFAIIMLAVSFILVVLAIKNLFRELYSDGDEHDDLLAEYERRRTVEEAYRDGGE